MLPNYPTLQEGIFSQRFLATGRDACWEEPDEAPESPPFCNGSHWWVPSSEKLDMTFLP